MEWEKLKAICLKSGPLSPPSLYIVLQLLASAMRQGKEVYEIQMGIGEIKLCMLSMMGSYP
jgi:hypothetical protein